MLTPITLFLAASLAAGPFEVDAPAPPASLPGAPTFNPVPSFERLKSDIDMVGDGLAPLLRLDSELQTLGEQLTAQVKRLAENQNDPVAASEANKLITMLQARLVNTIGEVLVNSDLIELGIGSANRKLQSLERYLKRTESRFVESSANLEGQIDDAKHAALDAVNEYLDFVNGLQEPIDRDDKLRALNLEARVQEQKFQLDLLRLDRKRQRAIADGYANMNAGLSRWIDDFNVLKSKTSVMVRQLEAEQAFLAKGIQMSVDAARVRHFMENPLALPDGTSIQAVNDKIARIFSMIDVFTGVQGRVQESLFGFNAVSVGESLTEKERDVDSMKSRARELKRQIVGE